MNDDFDDMVRSRLHHTEPTTASDASRVLGELRPAMRRARLQRGAAVGAFSLSFLGVAVIGVAALTASLRPQPSDVDVFDDGIQLPETPPVSSVADEIDDDAADDLSIDGTSPRALPAPTSTENGASTTSVPTTSTSGPKSTEVGTAQPATHNNPPATPAPQPRQPRSSPTSTAPPRATTASTTAAPTSTTTTSSTTTTTSTPTTSPPTGQRTIQSNCGSISVSHSGNSISLTGMQPASGFVADVKDSGPEKIDVRFDNGPAECEIKAWVEAGVLQTEIDNHDEDDD